MGRDKTSIEISMHPSIAIPKYYPEIPISKYEKYSTIWHNIIQAVQDGYCIKRSETELMRMVWGNATGLIYRVWDIKNKYPTDNYIITNYDCSKTKFEIEVTAKNLLKPKKMLQNMQNNHQRVIGVQIEQS